jgi:ubiquitin-protein ligase
MEKIPYDYVLSGEIKGMTKEQKNKKEKISINKMQYIAKKIMEEINFKFKNDPNLHIYDRYSKKYNILQIFVIFFGNKRYNKRTIDITFLIIIKEEYPISPPLVFCLTEFNKYFDIFNMRNIQNNLIPEWSNNFSINDLIEKIPSLLDSIDYQVSQKLLPSIGEYLINGMHYDINDFLLNSKNKVFKLKILVNDNSDEDVEFIPMYLIITKTNLIFLKQGHKPHRNLCKIKYIINLIGIERIRRFLKEGEVFEGLSCFKIVANNKENINNAIFSKTICVKDNNFIVKEINDLINKRKDDLMYYFKFFENSCSNGVNELEKIIGIKERILAENPEENLFNQIQGLYNKLIEMSSNMEHNDFSVYVKKLQKFLDHYDTIKNNKSEDKNNINSNSINLKGNNYNFGFE